MKDPWLFYHQGPTWSNDTYGLPADEHGALSSVINLYDNILVFPGKAKRSVKYRYVNIGEAEVLSTEAVAAAIAKDGPGTNDVVSDYKIATLDGDNKATIQNTDNSRKPYIGQEYLGYNVGNMDTELKAQNVIKTKVAAHAVDSTQPLYETPAFKEEKDETIIVEIYYRDKVSGFNEVHTYYDADENIIAGLQKRIKYDTDENGEAIYDGSTRTVSKLEDAAYSYIGAYKSKTYEANPPKSSYDKTLNEITLKINESNSDDNWQFANFGYQQSSNVIERHVVYCLDSAGVEFSACGDIASPVTHKVPADLQKELLSITGLEYVGVTRVNTIDINAAPPDKNSTGWSSATRTLIVDSDKNQTIFFGYIQRNVNIFVRHILYDANGENPKVLSQYKESVTSDRTIDGGGKYSSEKIKYKGYIKTHSEFIQTDDGPVLPSIRAYLEGTQCDVTLKEVKKGEVWVNFLYKVVPQEKEIDRKPDIDVKAKLDFEAESSSAIQTESCESSVYKTNSVIVSGLAEGGWDPILSIPINTKLKFGIISQPKYIIAGVKTKKEEVEVNHTLTHIKKQFYVNTTVIAHGLNNREEPTTITNTFNYIFPYKYAIYELEEQKFFKLYNANVYAPGFSHAKTIGEKMFGDTDKYNYEYSLDDKYINFKKGDNFDPNLTGMEAEFYIDPALYGTTGLANNYSIEKEAMLPLEISNNSVLSIIDTVTSVSGLRKVFGFEASIDEVPTFSETVHVYPSGTMEGDSYGKYGAYKYSVLNNDDQPVTLYLEIQNKANLMYYAETLWEKIKAALVNFWNWITGDDAEYDEDMEIAILKGLAQNVSDQLNGTTSDGGIRDILFSLILNTKTQQSTLDIDDTIIAKNNASKSEDVTIDSNNFTANSVTPLQKMIDAVLSISPTYFQKSYVFPGWIDVSETGIMTITTTGRKYYTEGFSPIEDLDKEKEVKDPKEYLVDTVNEKAKNGIRLFAGDVKYKPNNNSIFQDNLYNSHLSSEGIIYTFTTDRLEYLKNINKDQTYMELLGPVEKAVKIVNVYTPIKVKGDNVKDLQIEEPETQLTVPMAESGITSRLLLETGFFFYIGVDKYPYDEYDPSYRLKYPVIGTLKDYLKSFYVKFDFVIKEFTVNDDGDHTGIKVNGSDYNGGVVSADTWIKINLPEILAKTPTTDVTNLKVTSKSKEVVVGKASYTVRALTKNIEDLEKPSLKAALASFYESYRNICNDKHPEEPTKAQPDSPVYYDEKKVEINIKNVERLYDFEVSDVKDIDWKSVFRSGVSHNNKLYYSGANRWQDGVKDPVNRSTKQIGTNPTRILPVGPFKHTDITYKNAPKMGYRISFDVKLTGGYIGANQIINVKPSFYYLSKDGTDFDKHIELYYKNSNGKYVKVGSTEDNYKLTFIPNDGYRYLDFNNIQHLSKTKVSLGKLDDLELTANTMSTDGYGYLTFYGEYKLPNSTIAVRTGDSISDTSKYLKDGYLGVKFDISYKDPTILGPYDPTITYSTGMKKITANPATSTQFSEIDNTSQWDFEGYMGMKYENYTKDLELKLENGTLTIDNETNDDSVYQNIKGTVVLFDLDARAASDFN